MNWNNFISDSVTVVVSAWSCFVLTLTVRSLILLNNFLAYRIGGIMVLNGHLNETRVIKFLVDQKIEPLILLIAFSLVDLVSNFHRSL